MKRTLPENSIFTREKMTEIIYPSWIRVKGEILKIVTKITNENLNCILSLTILLSLAYSMFSFIQME